MDIATSTKTPSGRVALKSHYITPAECNIPSSFREQKTLHHIPIRIGAQNTLKYPINKNWSLSDFINIIKQKKCSYIYFYTFSVLCITTFLFRK